MNYFEIGNWHVTKVGETEVCYGGVLHVMSNQEVEVWVLGEKKVARTLVEDGEEVRDFRTEKVERLAGVGRTVRLNVGKEKCHFIVRGKPSAHVQYYDVESPVYHQQGEKFLNGDRQPLDGTVMEGSMRLQRLRENAERRALTAERMAEAKREREKRAEREAEEKKLNDALDAKKKRQELEDERAKLEPGQAVENQGGDDE